MANKLIRLQKARQIFCLYSQGKGSKAISNMLSLSGTTVKKYLSRLQESGQGIESVLTLGDLELQDLL